MDGLCKTEISTAYKTCMNSVEQCLQYNPKKLCKNLHMKQGTFMKRRMMTISKSNCEWFCKHVFQYLQFAI